MKINKLLVENILDFEKKIGEKLVVEERSKGKFFADFEHCELKQGFFLISSYETGTSVKSAVKNLCKKISNKTIVFYAMVPSKSKVIKVPLLEYNQ